MVLRQLGWLGAILLAAQGFASWAATSPADAESAPGLQSPAAPPLAVAAVRVGTVPGRTRVVFDLDGVPRFHVSSPTPGDRIAIDLHNVQDMAAAAAELFAGTVVERLHSVPDGASGTRVELDLARALPYFDVFSLAPGHGRGHRLVVDLYDAAPQEVAPQAVTEEAAAVAGKAAGPVTAVDAADAAVGGASAGYSAMPADGAESGAGRLSAQPPAAGGRQGVDISFSGIVEQEWAYATGRHRHQKFETLIEPRVGVKLGDNLAVTMIGRIRLDAVGDLGPDERRPDNYSGASAPWYNSGHAELSLREFYADFSLGRTTWRIGKQQVIWGQADGIKVLDVVNPQSYREFILDEFDDSRIPLWMGNVNLPLGDNGNLQLLWIPDTSYHELADLTAPFAARSPRLVPPLPITAVAGTDRPDDPLRDGDFGFQLSGFVGGWDLSLNYLYHYLDTPVLPVRQLPSGQLLMAPEFRRSHLLGGTFSTVLGNVTLRGELAYNTDTFQPVAELHNAAIAESPELSSVIGLDWLPKADILVSAQWFNSYLPDHTAAMARDDSEQLVTLLYQQDFANAVWNFRALGLYSTNDGDSLLQLKLSYWVSSSLKVWLGADVFSGTRAGLFGQYAAEDRMLLGFEYGF